MTTGVRALCAMASLAAAGCAKSPQESRGESPAVPPPAETAAAAPTGGAVPAGDSAARSAGRDTVGADTTGLRRLEAAARALAKTDGCTRSKDCRAAPVGAKACGGPRAHVAYCARTTDSAALYDALERLEQAERAFNARHGVVSTCEFLVPPPVAVVGGQCRAGAPGDRQALPPGAP